MFFFCVLETIPRKNVISTFLCRLQSRQIPVSICGMRYRQDIKFMAKQNTWVYIFKIWTCIYLQMAPVGVSGDLSHWRVTPGCLAWVRSFIYPEGWPKTFGSFSNVFSSYAWNLWGCDSYPQAASAPEMDDSATSTGTTWTVELPTRGGKKDRLSFPSVFCYWCNLSSMDVQVMVGLVAPDYWRYDLITDRSHLFGCALFF